MTTFKDMMYSVINEKNEKIDGASQEDYINNCIATIEAYNSILNRLSDVIADRVESNKKRIQEIKNAEMASHSQINKIAQFADNIEMFSKDVSNDSLKLKTFYSTISHLHGKILKFK